MTSFLHLEKHLIPLDQIRYIVANKDNPGSIVVLKDPDRSIGEVLIAVPESISQIVKGLK